METNGSPSRETERKLINLRKIKQSGIDSILLILKDPEFNKKPENITFLRTAYDQYEYACEAINEIMEKHEGNGSRLANLLLKYFDVEPEILCDILRESYDIRRDMIKDDAYDSEELKAEIVKLDTEDHLLGLLRCNE